MTKAEARLPTYKQYEQAEIRAIAAEYGCTLKEAAECRQETWLRPEWVRLLTAKVSEGGTIPASVWRTMSDEERYSVQKFGNYTHR